MHGLSLFGIMAARKRRIDRKRYAHMAAALAFYGLTMTTVDSGFIGDWVKGKCGGEERWDIKTLTDQPGRQLNVDMAIPSSIAELAQLAPDFDPRHTPTRQPMERQLYTIECTIEKVIKEDDEDLHLVLSDGHRTMVGEIVCPFCDEAAQSGRKTLFKNVFSFFNPFRAKKAYKRYRWSVTGVAFEDFSHGQTGMAPNCVELHPIVDIHPLDTNTP